MISLFFLLEMMTWSMKHVLSVKCLVFDLNCSRISTAKNSHNYHDDLIIFYIIKLKLYYINYLDKHIIYAFFLTTNQYKRNVKKYTISIKLNTLHPKNNPATPPVYTKIILEIKRYTQHMLLIFYLVDQKIRK